MVFQDYRLFPHLDVRGNVAFGARARGVGRESARAAADAWLERLDLGGLATRRPAELSGGQAQRVALARALATEPAALLLDEPLAALDVHSRHEVRRFLASSLKNLGLPTVVVSHDADDARCLGHRVAVLEAGRLVQVGPWEDLARRPASRFVEEFVASAGPLAP